MGKDALPTIQIAGGRIIDPSQNRDELGDLWISRGHILPTGASYEEAEIVIDASWTDRLPRADRRARPSARTGQ